MHSSESPWHPFHVLYQRLSNTEGKRIVILDNACNYSKIMLSSLHENGRQCPYIRPTTRAMVFSECSIPCR